MSTLVSFVGRLKQEKQLILTGITKKNFANCYAMRREITEQNRKLQI